MSKLLFVDFHSIIAFYKQIVEVNKTVTFKNYLDKLDLKQFCKEIVEEENDNS